VKTLTRGLYHAISYGVRNVWLGSNLYYIRLDIQHSNLTSPFITHCRSYRIAQWPIGVWAVPGGMSWGTDSGNDAVAAQIGRKDMPHLCLLCASPPMDRLPSQLICNSWRHVFIFAPYVPGGLCHLITQNVSFFGEIWSYLEVVPFLE
jgi:hypothetical protein